jgi:hypothetical protein
MNVAVFMGCDTAHQNVVSTKLHGVSAVSTINLTGAVTLLQFQKAYQHRY